VASAQSLSRTLSARGPKLVQQRQPHCALHRGELLESDNGALVDYFRASSFASDRDTHRALARNGFESSLDTRFAKPSDRSAMTILSRCCLSVILGGQSRIRWVSPEHRCGIWRPRET